ncbi:MAG: PEGA domain-containing protein [Myxococcota bacterium]
MTFALFVSLLAAAAPAPAEDAPQGQLLLICSRQGATVFVDGEAKGMTPLDVLSLTPGLHRIEITASDAEPFTAVVEILPKQLTRLEAQLANQAILPPLAVGAPGIETQRKGHTPIITRWWFWGVVAALGAAVVVTGVQLSAGNDFVPGGELEPTDTTDWTRF